MQLYSIAQLCSTAIFLIFFGIGLFIILGTLGTIFFINYGINNFVGWLVMILGILCLLISILFSTRIQYLESYKNKRIYQREQQRRKERNRAKRMIGQHDIFYINTQDRFKDNGSSPPCYDDVIKYT